MEDYEFRIENLNGFNIECKVCRYYNLGHCEHSNFHKLDECNVKTLLNLNIFMIFNGVLVKV